MSSVKTETQSKTKVVKLSAKFVKNDSKVGADWDESFHVKDTEVNNNEETPEDKPTEFKAKIVWFNAIGFLVLHLAAVYGLVLALVRAKFLTLIWGKFGITPAAFIRID